jgi:hypothetical protein
MGLLESARDEFRRMKALSERALQQVQGDGLLHKSLDQESNSLAVIVQHVGGNLLSRWTDFLSSDGEKPTRDRDREFEERPELGRQELLEIWEKGWAALFTTLEALRPEDLQRTVYIRGEAFEVLEALNRSLTHTASHVGQIVFLSKHLSSERWTSLSIPRGRSKNAPGSYKATR